MGMVKTMATLQATSAAEIEAARMVELEAAWTRLVIKRAGYRAAVAHRCGVAEARRELHDAAARVQALLAW